MDLDAHVLAGAERAADAGERHTHQVLGQPQTCGDLTPVDVQPLRRDEQVDASVGGRHGQSALGAERRLVLHARLVVAVDPEVRLHGGDVAVGDVHVPQHVAEGMQAAGPWVERGFHVDERLDRLVVDLDQGQGVPCLLDGLGRDERHRLALVAHLACGEHRLVGDLEPVGGPARDVACGEDGVDSRRGPRGRHVEPADVRRRVRGAQRQPVEQLGRREVAAVEVGAARLRGAVDPARTLAHAAVLEDGAHARRLSAMRTAARIFR